MLLQFPKPLPCLFLFFSCMYISDIGPRLTLPHIHQGVPFPGLCLGFVPWSLSSWFKSSKFYNGKALFIYFCQVLFLSNVSKSLCLEQLSRQCSGKRKKKIMRSPYTLWSTGDFFFSFKFSVQQNICFVFWPYYVYTTVVGPANAVLQLRIPVGQDQKRKQI